MSSSDTHAEVGITDLLKGVAKMATDLGGMAKHAPSLVVRKPATKRTIGLVFQRHAANHPDRPFVRYQGRTTT